MHADAVSEWITLLEYIHRHSRVVKVVTMNIFMLKVCTLPSCPWVVSMLSVQDVLPGCM